MFETKASVNQLHFKVDVLDNLGDICSRWEWLSWSRCICSGTDYSTREQPNNLLVLHMLNTKSALERQVVTGNKKKVQQIQTYVTGLTAPSRFAFFLGVWRNSRGRKKCSVCL